MGDAAERAVLAVIHGPGWPVADDAAELAELARSAGAVVTETIFQTRGRYDPSTLFSSGKVEEIERAIASHAAGLVLCNRDLSPRQQMHLEKATKAKVIDRTRLILDIFARRARSREGRIQVELAQCLYLLPRLGGLVEELDRTGGGIGTRGPGETQLDADRRRVRARIAALKNQLSGVSHTRALHRRARPDDVPLVALVGYTNAGKSTLHRALTGSDVLIADALFATLDPTTRLLSLPENRRALLSDTVGFIHDLPPHLVAAFRATLEEVTQADLLLEVVDASDPRCWEQRAAVSGVLEHLDALRIPRLLVWNKVDLPWPGSQPATMAHADADRTDAETTLEGSGDLDVSAPTPGRGNARPTPERARSEESGGGGGGPALGSELPAVSVSALHGSGLDALRSMIVEHLPSPRVSVHVQLPFEAEALVAAVRRDAQVLDVSYGEHGITLLARCTPSMAARLRRAEASAHHDTAADGAAASDTLKASSEPFAGATEAKHAEGSGASRR